MVKLEVGKYYKTRDGRKVGPMRYATAGTMSDGSQSWWADSGEKVRGMEQPADIVSEWVDYSYCEAAQVDVQREEYGPIRTRREIVPGTYGVIRIDRGANGFVLDMWKANPNAEELREAAHLFNQLAEALDDNRA